MGLETAKKLVTQPGNVEAHSFYPLIRYVIKSTKVKRDPVTQRVTKQKPKERPIAYAAHLDSHIYSYYAHILAKKYETVIREAGFSPSVLAFRALEKNNIEFAYDAFNEIRAHGECHVLALDIEGFFDNLDHVVLKKEWATILGTGSLPNDHYAVFKSLTRYSYVDRESLYACLGISVNNPRNGRHQLCTATEFREIVRPAKLIQRYDKPYGIPQGSPLSALLSNIYMRSFDAEISAFVAKNGGSYFRYCDDILLIVPSAIKTEVFAVVESEIAKIKLKIQARKTEARDFVYQNGNLITSKPLQYLGFLFDGHRIFLRSAALARYSERMSKGVWLAKRTMKKRNAARILRDEPEKPLFTKKLYRLYSFSGRRNFITYGYRAAKVMGSSTIKRQLKRLWSKLQAEIADK